MGYYMTEVGLPVANLSSYSSSFSSGIFFIVILYCCLYKLNSILRRHYGFIMTASWEKIYSVYICRLKIEFSFVSQSNHYKDK